MCGSRGGNQGFGPLPPPLKNHNNIGFLSNSGPDPLKNYEATEPAFNVGLSSAPQPNAILMAFCWRADDGLFIVVFGHFHPSSTKKNPRCQIWTPLTNFSGSAHVVGKEWTSRFYYTHLCTYSYLCIIKLSSLLSEPFCQQINANQKL